MKLRKDLLKGIKDFLDTTPGQTLKRGRKYFLGGAVLELKCVEPDHRYTARVRGGEVYEVELDYDSNIWFTECSCPQGGDCKHGVAAMLELERLAKEGDSQDASDSPSAKTKTARAAPAVPQPPVTPLYSRLVENLGRKLTATEGAFIRVVQSLYQQALHRNLTEYDLGTLMRMSQNYHFNWAPVELWPEFPRDDFYFWLHLAWEFRKRECPLPPYMEAISDLNLIKDSMEAQDRARELERWNNWFRDFQGHAPAEPAAPLELRLMVQADQALLEWRSGPEGVFTPFKQSHATKFSEQFAQGELNLAPESLPLWSAVHRPWQYESWWSFKYSNATARPALNRLLRMPLTPERIVTPTGQALVRVAEPLRLNLKPATEAGGNYELTLVTAAGLPPPRILCTFTGQPTLYLTERELFHGPPADALNDEALKNEWRKLIPAPALETINGLNFLQASGIPLPERLAQRVKLVPVNVTVSCVLQHIYAGSQAEEIVVDVTARVPGMPAEKYLVGGWQSKTERKVTAHGLPENGIIVTPDRAAQRHFPRLLDALGVKWDQLPGAWKLRLTKKNPEVFAAWLKSIPSEIEVRLDPELASLRDEPVSGTVSLDVEENGVDWFDLKVVLNVGDTTLTPEELKLLLNARGGFVRLGSKGWRRLQFNLTAEDDEQLARLGLHAGDFSSEPQRFHALQLADTAAKKFLPAEHAEKIERRVNELKTRVTPTMPPEIRAELRPYQVDGFHFLAYLTANRFGGVLADDMGLGKTLQTLAWLAWLKPEATATTPPPARLPSLVVCPKSVTDNWRAEAERFYPDLKVRVWRGEPAEALAAARENAGLLVMNYAQLRSLSPAIARVHWLAVILDEAQCIKNPDSQTAGAARALSADHRLALTGTPIENQLLDLWSIMAFAMPGALGNRAHFLRRFNAQDDPLARRRLAARVRPFLLRRTKKQVAGDLPDRTEEDLLCEMEGQQLTLYRAELKRARQIILGLKSHQQLNDQRFNILTSLLRLRQICCHPVLVDVSLRDAESAKVTALEELLEPLMEEGHKVLVFSQFVTMLDLLRDNVQKHGWQHFYLSGETEDRGDLVREFQAAPGGAVFLISLKAGGFGLNLTAASYVVLFDPWWNPAVENQAIDRTHRIGQTSKVMAYRLVMRDSIEQKIRALQKQKAALADDVLGEERFTQSLTLDDLRFLFAE
jgi:hypothetical protein